MSRGFHLLAILLAGLTVSAAYQPDKNEPQPAPTTEVAIYKGLRDVINHGAEVYNRNDYAGCYRIYEGSLLTVKPMLGQHPDLQQSITKALEAAKDDPVVWRRAFTLRAALDKVRAELKPKKANEKPDELKKPENPDKDKKPAPKNEDKKAEQLPAPEIEEEDK